MAVKLFSGITIEVTDEGYMLDSALWTREIAVEIAKEEKIVLSDIHYAIIEFLQNRFNSGASLSIRSINHSGITDVKTFYQLFPGAPLKKASRIAGLPKPSNCI